MINNVFFVISIASGVCAALWMHIGTPYKLLAGLNVAVPAIAFLLFCLFYDVATHAGKGRKQSIVSYGWTLSMFPLMFRSRHDFNYDSYAQFILPCAILSGCALLLFVAFNLHKRLKVFGGLAVGVATFFCFAVGPLNFVLDAGTRTAEQSATVLAQAAQMESTPFETCYFLLITDKGYPDFMVSRETYDAVKEGDAVRVVTHLGPLGIDYTEVLPFEQVVGR